MDITYQCTQCGKPFSPAQVTYLCPHCGPNYIPGGPLTGILQVLFDYEAISKEFNKDKPDWSLLSAVEPEYYPQVPVGNTPFFKAYRLGELIGLKNLWIKNDGLSFSGSLKDRASFLMVAEANRIGEATIVTASTGNAASALAAICANAGKKAVIFVPKSAPKAKLVSLYLYGAEVIEVDGPYDLAFALSLEYTQKHKGLNRNTAYHPLTIEGKKTVALEIIEQNGFVVPDVIVIPVGDGVIISGVFKGFSDMIKAGIIAKMPRLIAVQAEKSNAIHQYIQTGEYHNALIPDTIADSISVSTPSAAHLARRAVLDSNGNSITVSDSEILDAQFTLAKYSGVFAEPAASSTLAGLQKLINLGYVEKEEQTVLLITGNGLKDIQAPLTRLNG